MDEVMKDRDVNEMVDGVSGRMSEAAFSAELTRAAEELRAVYPDFDLVREMADDEFRGMVTGQIRPSLRQIYEACHYTAILEEVVARRSAETVDFAVRTAVDEAVGAAVADTEANLIHHIRARGQRPSENGTRGAAGVRMHPAVGRLSRQDRARLAERAERGETIRL